MAQPFELKFIVDLADALGQVQSFAEGMGVVYDAVAKVGQVGQDASAGIDTLTTATAAVVQGTETMVEIIGAATAAENAEAAELARLTELLGSEEMARASMNARIIDMTVAQEAATTTTTAAAQVAQEASVSTRAYNDELSRSAAAAMAGAEAEENLVTKVRELPPAFTAAQQAMMRTQQATREGFAAFSAQTQEIGTLVGVLGLASPRFFGAAYGLQMVGQAAEMLGPKIVEAGGGILGFVEVLGPIVAVGAAVAGTLIAVAGAAELMSAAIKAAIPEQESETSFAILLGSVEKAKARIEELDETALKFHLDPDQVRGASEQLTRLSQGALGAGDSLNTVIEMSARSGKSLTEMGAIFGRLYEVIQSGQPIARMGTQLEKLGILSASDVNELNNLHKEGAKAPAIWDAAQAALNRYGGAAEARANTFEGATKGMAADWTLFLEALGRPIVDVLTPFLQRATQELREFIPEAKEAGVVLATLPGIIVGVVNALNALTLVLSGNVTGAFAIYETKIVGAGSVTGAAANLIQALLIGLFNSVKAIILDVADVTVTTLDIIFAGSIKSIGNFVNQALSLLSALPGQTVAGMQQGVDAAVNLSTGGLDKLTGKLHEVATTANGEVAGSVVNVAGALAHLHNVLVGEGTDQQKPPNADKQFTPMTPGPEVEPDGKQSKVAARTKEVNEGKVAEQEYKDALESTKGMLEAGDLSQTEATAQNIKTTQDYIAHLQQLQATMDPASEKYQKMTAQINMARASLLKLAEGQEEYQATLDLTKSKLDAGIISQSQADKENNATITAQIARLRQLQTTVSQTSAAYEALETKINNLKASQQQTTALGQITANFHKVINAWGDLGKNVSEWVNNTMNSGVATLSSGIMGLINHTTTWRQTFNSAINSMLEGLIQLGIKTVLHYALQKAGMESNAQVGNQTTASVVTTQVSAGAAIAAAHAPAAAATSVSSYGVAAVVGAVLAIAAIGAIIALLAGGFAEGGLIPGSPSHSDNRIARVATGEFVIRTAAVQHWGPEMFEALNNFQFPIRMPAYAAGGMVGAAGAGFVGGSRDRARIVNEVSVGGPKVTLIQPNTRSAMHEAMRTAEGDLIILDSIKRQKHKIPFKR